MDLEAVFEFEPDPDPDPVFELSFVPFDLDALFSPAYRGKEPGQVQSHR
jgi:hypothetical protein